MLPCFCCFYGPWDMHVVRQRIVDGFNFRISQQLLIGSVCLWNAQVFSRLLGSAPITRSNSNDFGVFPFLQRRNNFLDPDICSAKYSPPNLIQAASLSVVKFEDKHYWRRSKI